MTSSFMLTEHMPMFFCWSGYKLKKKMCMFSYLTSDIIDQDLLVFLLGIIYPTVSILESFFKCSRISSNQVL